MTIKIDNSPNWYEYLFVALLAFQGIAVIPSQYILLFPGIIILAINLLLYNKKANIILREASLEIHFKVGFVTYRKLHQHFTKIIVSQDSIHFYNDDEIVFSLDVGLAYDENEASSISLWAKQKNSSLGNKKNYLQIFNQIKQFYLSQNSPGIYKL